VTPGDRFADRADAGRRLGARLAERPRPGALVLGLPRGGVLVAAEVARALGAPLDLLVVAKLRLPGHPELAMGAVAAVAGGGSGAPVATVRVEQVLAAAGVAEEVFARARDAAAAGLPGRAAAWRGDRRPPVLAGRPLVLVDDGVATGATLRAAVGAARAQGPATLAVAVPVGSVAALAALEREVDELVCLTRPEMFRSVDQVYADFSETTDAEVRAALAAAPAG
jgi:putative phosphoribosyl transferase